MFVLPMSRREIGHQVLPVVRFRVETLSRGIRCIPDKLLLGYESVQLGDVAPVEGINEALDDLADSLGRALIWSTGRARCSSHLATGQKDELRAARHD